MGYMHIDNLYKDQRILELLKKVYALEKLHGTSAHTRWNGPSEPLKFFSGGEKHANFVKLFDEAALRRLFSEIFDEPPVTVYGEAYGGKCQGMKETYGSELKFCVFDVKVGDVWLAVPQADDVAQKLGLEFVHYDLIDATEDAVNAARDADSVQAIRNGMGPGHKREGVVLRPPIELTLSNGARLMAKHKRDDFRETRTPRRLGQATLDVLQEAQAIADEWVTPMRMDHVIDQVRAAKKGEDLGVRDTGDIVRALLADVSREAKGEIVEGKDARKAISKKAAQMWQRRVKNLKG
jgi:hypothetical protein